MFFVFLQFRTKWWSEAWRISRGQQLGIRKRINLRQGIILLRWWWWSDLHCHIHRWRERFPTISCPYSSCIIWVIQTSTWSKSYLPFPFCNYFPIKEIKEKTTKRRKLWNFYFVNCWNSFLLGYGNKWNVS